jgi:hypothetical protein
MIPVYAYEGRRSEHDIAMMYLRNTDSSVLRLLLLLRVLLSFSFLSVFGLMIFDKSYDVEYRYKSEYYSCSCGDGVHLPIQYINCPDFPT